MALLTTAARNDLTRVRAAYAFSDEDTVTARLEESPFLIPLLEEARGRLAAHFGADAPVRIDPAFNLEELDPDLWDRSLFARVETDLPPHDALARLGDFEEEWWLDAGSASRNLLHFDIG